MRVYLFWCIPFRTEYDDQDLSTIPFLRRLFLGLNPVSILIDGLLWLPDCSALMTTIVAFWICILSFWTMGFGLELPLGRCWTSSVIMVLPWLVGRP